MKKTNLLVFSLFAIFFMLSAAVGLAYDCVCTSNSTPWGCPFMANDFWDIRHNQSCGGKHIPPQACGPVDCSTPLANSKTINKDFFVNYNVSVVSPGQCTAFAIHGGGIDKGVSGIIDGLLYCPGIWGKYEFSGPSMEYHVTETKFNEPCYDQLRKAGKTRIHIHSNIGADPNTICVGTKAKTTAPNFVDNLRTALKSRNATNVVVEYKGVGKCANVSGGTLGRDELGLEIHKGLAEQMSQEAGQCKNTSTTRFGALVESLCKSFPSCCAGGVIGGQSTFPHPGCGVGY
ncbi:MAG: poly-gamma-glutamate hydrolase family protein [Oligoflexia bacterium]|nr:poly-gamma-glutamate hydrolase family protein [Oligoflexia bacterium]